MVHPLIVLSDGAAGHFYNFENEDFLYEAPEYRHLLVKNTSGPLHFYNMYGAAAAPSMHAWIWTLMANCAGILSTRRPKPTPNSRVQATCTFTLSSPRESGETSSITER